MRTTRQIFRYVWAGPTTALGLIGIALGVASGARVRCVTGVLEAHGGLITILLRYGTCLRGGAAAITLGHVVLGRDAPSLAATRRHERVHVRQSERWGPFFLPAYLLSSLWALVCGRRPYFDNHFEREAYRAAPASPPTEPSSRGPEGR